MQLKLYSLLFVALELALLTTKGMAYYDDDYELASRDLGLDGFAHHYLREFYDSDLSHVATRDLVIELEGRLFRRGGSGGGNKKHKGVDWSKLSVGDLETKLAEITGHLTGATPDQKKKFERQIAALKKLISKKGGSIGGGTGGGTAAAKTGVDSTAVTDGTQDPNAGTQST
ncbi:hypothetical protein BJ165DRAFT_1612775 [Panaeolus papilionaceus]|nr:hypothetical protein BJ165DRAFT_1612775 [Panaeolus papilionaceus]